MEILVQLHTRLQSSQGDFYQSQPAPGLFSEHKMRHNPEIFLSLSLDFLKKKCNILHIEDV